MGLLRKPSPERAPAAAEIRFSDAAVAVAWTGDLGLLVRSPHIYLDWAVNKDQKNQAQETLAIVREFVDEPTPDRVMPTERDHIPAVADPVAGVTVAFTDAMRCKVAFRPRRVILTYLYPTFWALWNELALQAGEEGPEAIEPLVDDLRTQLDYYARHGIGMRGGVAPVLAGQVGAGQRLAQETAERAGLSLDDFRALSESERDAIIGQQVEEDLERARETFSDAGS